MRGPGPVSKAVHRLSVQTRYYFLVADTESGNGTPLLKWQRAPRLEPAVQQSKMLHPDKIAMKQSLILQRIP